MPHPIQIEPDIDPVPLSRAEIQANYDRLSNWYDLLAGVWEKQAREAGLRQFEAKAGERVLEIGPGPGHNLAAMAGAVGASGRVYGLDLSPRMIGVAQARLAQAGVQASTSGRK